MIWIFSLGVIFGWFIILVFALLGINDKATKDDGVS